MRARETKERLSGVKSFRIPFTFCIPPFVEQITRDEFEKLINNFIEKTRKLVLKALREAYIGALLPDDIDRVLLEGGSSSMPWVKDMLIGIFNDENKIYTSERPALDISLGATYYAAMKMGVLTHPDLQAEKVEVEFEVTFPMISDCEADHGRKSFFTMIKEERLFSGKESHIFTLTGKTPEDMTTWNLKF